MRLFSYCIPVDDGAAPNPFWGICTLTICKPKIRRIAKVGDWVAGVGSKNVDGTDFSGKLVYAMKVTDVLSLKDYDQLCRKELENKIPDIHSNDYRKRMGDCIYDFEKDPNGRLRLSVHNLSNKKRDLGGMNSLLSTHFYYFGDQPIEIPDHLRGMIKQVQGHKSGANDPIKLQFVEWIENTGYKINSLNGKPQIEIIFDQEPAHETTSCRIRCRVAEADEEVDDDDIC